MQHLLAVNNLSKNIADTFTLKPTSFTQDKGQKLGMAGATGSGKSTLLKLIAGLQDADGGEAFFEGKKILGPAWRLIPGQPGIAYLSQHYELRNHFRMEELLSYADQLPEGKAAELFALCSIDHLLKRKTDQLSGGEKQRIALARLLLTAPRLLILDEPFSNLDLIHKSILKEVLNNISAEMDISCIVASHDPTDILPWADTLMLMHQGSLLQQGTPEQVYATPVNEYAGGLLGHYNLLDSDTAHALNIKVPKTKRAFLRPEWLVFSTSGGLLPVTVVQSSFQGSHYQITGLYKGKTIKWNNGTGKLAPGEKGFLSLLQEKVCLL
ncbi:MAG: ABC transporter ATP-binding protein [Edaphocola sp.]